MSALIVDIADALATALNDHAFSQAFTAVRAWRPRASLEELTALTVTVVPKAWEQVRVDRVAVQRSFDFDVCIQKKMLAADNAEADPLFELAEEIAEFLRNTRLTMGSRTAQWMKVAGDPIYAIEHWDQERVFTGPQTHTYVVFG